MIVDGHVSRNAKRLGLEVDVVNYAKSLLRIDAHLSSMQCCICCFHLGQGWNTTRAPGLIADIAVLLVHTNHDRQ